MGQEKTLKYEERLLNQLKLPFEERVKVWSTVCEATKSAKEVIDTLETRHKNCKCDNCEKRRNNSTQKKKETPSTTAKPTTDPKPTTSSEN